MVWNVQLFKKKNFNCMYTALFREKGFHGIPIKTELLKRNLNKKLIM